MSSVTKMAQYEGWSLEIEMLKNDEWYLCVAIFLYLNYQKKLNSVHFQVSLG